MAIEQGLGAGGIPDEPMVEDNTRMVELPDLLPEVPGITELDDGSAVVGEYEEEGEPVEEIAITCPTCGAVMVEDVDED